MSAPHLAFLCLLAGPLPSLVKGLRAEAEDWTDLKGCRRPCDGVPKQCYLKLHVERYTVLGPACGRCHEGRPEDCDHPQCVTADGFQRSIFTANRQYPAPPIEVCKGDQLIVDVINQMPDTTTSIHWHGIRQNGTQYYDGVPYVTQCPILPMTAFRYKFHATEAGTYFYHSHTGTQKLDGLAGPLVVRETIGEDLNSGLYDEDLSEHVVFISDWTHVPAEHLMPGLHSDTIAQSPLTFLINGRGQYFDKSSQNSLPIEEFLVEEGKRYRFRLISGTCMTCGVLLTIEGHNLTAITADGGLSFAPTTVDSVMLSSADRFDVILNAVQPGGIYKMELKGVGPGCAELYQSAVIRYKGSDFSNAILHNHRTDLGIVLNDITSRCEQPSTGLGSELCMSHLKGTTDAPKITDPNLYHQIELGFNFKYSDANEYFKENTYILYDEPMKHVFAELNINNISFSPPPSPPISQLDEIPKEKICSEECKNGNISNCVCTNIYDVKLNSVVDLIITDEDTIVAHPFHLHGYNFHIMEMRGGFLNLPQAVADVKERLRQDRISTENRPLRDSIVVPYGGYVAVRFTADNPGFWIMHCHFAFHLEHGMAAVLKVGELSDLPPVPKNFPRCGNFL